MEFELRELRVWLGDMKPHAQLTEIVARVINLARELSTGIVKSRLHRRAEKVPTRDRIKIQTEEDVKRYLDHILAESQRVYSKIPDQEIIIRFSRIAKKDLTLLKSELKLITPKIDQWEFRKPSGASAGFGVRELYEWIIPATIAIVIGKGLLDGFLKEFGADGAKALKRILQRAFTKGKKERRALITLFPDGIPSGIMNVKTPPISITTSLDIKGNSVKFEFPYELTEKQFKDALEAIPSVIPIAKNLAQLSSEKSKATFRFSYLASESKWVLNTLRKSKRIAKKTPSKKKS